MKRVVKINQETINAALPSIPQDFERDMRDMIARLPQQRKETPVMKRKISVGLVFALVLMLMAVSALAAVLLGGKDFVDQIMAPMAQENMEENKYTNAQIEEILRIAEENDIHLPDHLLETLARSDDGYYKEELMRQFVKTEHGFYPSAWPLEVQHWYEEMLEACGQGDGHIANVLPEGENELTKEQALQAALDFIKATYHEAADLTDPAHYRVHMQYTETIVNPYLKERNWWFEFEALDVVSNIYYLSMKQDGTVDSHSICGGIYAPSWQMPGQFISDRFAWTYGDGYGQTMWTTERLQEFQKALQHRVDTEGEDAIIAREKHALHQTYLTYDENTMIPAEQAKQIAQDFMKDYTLAPAYNANTPIILMLGEKGPVWKTMVTVEKDGTRLGRAFIEMDARTGEITASDTTFEAYREWRIYVTEAYWEKNKPAETSAWVNPNPTPRPDGKPWMWDNEMFPDWYWEKLDAVNYNGDTASDLMNGWYQDYGLDSLFWPLEAQAIDYYWHQIYSEGDIVFPGLPSDTDITQEQAVEKARTEWEKLHGDVLGELGIEEITMDDVICGVSFWFNKPAEGKNCWQITLMNQSGGVFGTVYLDAATGRVLANGLWNDDMEALLSGKPASWYNASFPDWFWEKLDAVNYNADTAGDLYGSWQAEYGEMIDFWPFEYQAIDYLWHEAASLHGDSPAIKGLPADTDITKEQALEIAAAAFKETYGEGLKKEKNISADELVYSVSYWFNEPQAGVNAYEIKPVKDGKLYGIIWVNAENGELEGMGCWDEKVVLFNQATPAPSPTPGPDGFPWFWGDPSLPAAHWDALEKAMQEMGITPDTLDAYVETWKTGNPPAMRDGDLNQFWPQTPKAIHHTFYNWSPKQDSGHYMMVEGEDGTISQALAAKIGDEAFKAYCQGKVDMEWVDSLAVSYCLWNEEETTGQPYWLIQYHDLSDVFNTRGWVKVDAKTGEILLLELDLFSNG